MSVSSLFYQYHYHQFPIDSFFPRSHLDLVQTSIWQLMNNFDISRMNW